MFVLFCFVLFCWSLLYSAILRSGTDSLRSYVILCEWIVFYSAFLNIHRSGVLTALAWLVQHETVAISARSVYTHALCHFMQSHIRKVHAYLAVTCHLHFWQNDWGLSRATAVERESRCWRWGEDTETRTRRRRCLRQGRNGSRRWCGIEVVLDGFIPLRCSQGSSP